jgi:hypothetical protein
VTRLTGYGSTRFQPSFFILQIIRMICFQNPSFLTGDVLLD